MCNDLSESRGLSMHWKTALHTSPLMTRYELSLLNYNPDKHLCLIMSWYLQYRVKLMRNVWSADCVLFQILRMMRQCIRLKNDFHTCLHITLQPIYWLPYLAIGICPIATYMLCMVRIFQHMILLLHFKITLIHSCAEISHMVIRNASQSLNLLKNKMYQFASLTDAPATYIAILKLGDILLQLRPEQ